MAIDGSLDEAVYASTPAISGFVQQEPNEFQPATEKTEAWIFFDDRQHLRLGPLLGERSRRGASPTRCGATPTSCARTTPSRCCSTPSTTGATATSSTPTRSAASPTARSPTKARPTSTGTRCGTVRTGGLRRRLDHRDGHPLQVAALRARPRADLGHQPPPRGALEERVVVPGAGAAGAHHVPRHAQGLVGGHPHRARGADRAPGPSRSSPTRSAASAPTAPRRRPSAATATSTSAAT